MSHFDAKAARAKRPLPLWVDAFTRDTALLETDEVGAYLKILMTMWSAHACALPNEPRKLAKAAGVSLRLWNSRIGPSIMGFFIDCDEGITQHRLRKEARYVERSVQAQSDRKSGALPESETYASPQVTPVDPHENAEYLDKPLKNNNVPSSVDDAVVIPPTYPTQQPNNLPKIDDADDSAGEELTFREQVIVAAGHDKSGMTATGGRVGKLDDWAAFEKACFDLSISQPEALRIVAETAHQKRDGPAGSLKYFIPPLREFAGARSGATVTPITAKRTGGQNAGRNFDDNHREYARLVGTGQIVREPDPSDPFA
jgi:uncharacterized protein YdaU (DUF1376 family)